MPRRKDPRAILATAFAIFVVVVACASVAQAGPDAPNASARVLVRVVTADDRALVERMRGQLSDLDIVLELAPESVLFDDTSAPSTGGDASVFAFVWFTRPEPSADRVVVRVRERRGRTSVREIGDGTPTPDGALGSATLEAAALVVREALRSIAAEGSVPPEPSTATPPPPKPSPRPRTARVSFRADFDWIAVFDVEGAVRHGPRLGLDARYRALELGLFAGTTLPTEDEDAYGVIRLRRHVFGARAGYAWQTGDGLALGVGLRAGLALYARSTESPKANVTPASGSVNPSLLVGPELSLGWAPGSGPIALVLTAGLDLVPSAPVIGYVVDGTFAPTLTIHRFQPVLGLGVAFDTARPP